jgi:hypothetical protein
MVVPLVAVSVVTVPVTSRATAVVVVAPVTEMSIVVGPSIVPFPFIAMALLPLPAFPIAMAIVVPVAIPARINDDSGRRLDIYRSRRSVDRLGRVRDTGNADAHSDIDVRECGRRYADTKSGEQCHRETAFA